MEQMLILRLSSIERFIVRERIVFYSLIYLEPVERFENRSNAIKFRSFGDSTSSRAGRAYRADMLANNKRQMSGGIRIRGRQTNKKRNMALKNLIQYRL